MDCSRHDHRSARAQIPLQRSRDKRELELDTANTTLDRKAPFQPKGAKANAVNSSAVGKNGASLNRRHYRDELRSMRWLPSHSMTGVRREQRTLQPARGRRT